MVASTTIRRLVETVNSLERRLGAPRQHVLFRYTSEADIQAEIARKRASGEIGPSDDVVIVQWIMEEAPDGRRAQA
jgi:hypothetical protein